MADGTFAVALIVAGLFEMGGSGCWQAGNCLARSETTPRIAFSSGEVLERRAKPAGEVYIRRDFGHKFGPFGTAAGLSIGENSEVWVGFGQTYLIDFGNSPFYAELHAMPGLYFPNGGFDLGGPIEFRSGIELGYENRQGVRFAISYDHRSNTGVFYDENPGIETVQFRVSLPTN